MRKLTLLLPVAAALAFAGAASAADSSVPAAFAAALDARAERPAPTRVPAAATGTFSALVTTENGKARIAWNLGFSHLSGRAVAAHIHLGKAGKAGPVALSLCGPCKASASGEAPLTAKLAKAIRSGGAYVNVHTRRNGGGEIRGQLGPSQAIAAGLVAAAETPAPKDDPAGAKGSFTALVVGTKGRPVLTWKLTFGGLSGNAVAAHIHLAKAGVAGPVVLSLCGPCSSGVVGRKAIDAKLAEAIESGGAYVNVHTQANPGGEIRGQLARATQGVAARASDLGTILVDDRGMTMYMWAKDKGTDSACYGQCAVFWPPALAAGGVVAAGDAKAALLGTAPRADGSTMLTYGGYPLYGFLPDKKPGDTNGEGSNGFGAPWWVLDAAKGTTIEKR